MKIIAFSAEGILPALQKDVKKAAKSRKFQRTTKRLIGQVRQISERAGSCLNY